MPNFLSNISFWVKIFNIREEFPSDQMIRENGGVIGHIDEVKINEATAEADGEEWVYANINVYDRLIFVHFIEFEPGADAIMIRFTYSRLKKFCFRCGSLTHEASVCEHEFPIIHNSQIDEAIA